MTTEATTDFQFLDVWGVPDELTETVPQWVGRIIAAGPAMPPERKAKKIAESGNTPRPEFHIIIEPLSFKYDSDRSMFEDDYEHCWFPMFRRDGKPVGPNTIFGKAKAAYEKLGFPINEEMAKTKFAHLRGKVFLFETRRETTVIGKNADGTDATTDTWIVLPVQRERDDYKHEGNIEIRKRPREKAGATAAMVDSNAAVALPKLVNVLRGKLPSEFFDAIIADGDPDITCNPYISEASADPNALKNRMLDFGMKLDAEGRLV